MQYVMEACAEANKPMIVLDRPNPKLCYGLDLSSASISKDGMMLNFFFDFFKRAFDKRKFFLATNGIERLAGTDQLRL